VHLLGLKPGERQEIVRILRNEDGRARVKDPATMKPEEGLKDAIWKMGKGHFRHLPVVDDEGKRMESSQTEIPD
jgi:CBS domain-containing protein